MFPLFQRKACGPWTPGYPVSLAKMVGCPLPGTPISYICLFSPTVSLVSIFFSLFYFCLQDQGETSNPFELSRLYSWITTALHGFSVWTEWGKRKTCSAVLRRFLKELAILFSSLSLLIFSRSLCIKFLTQRKEGSPRNQPDLSLVSSLCTFCKNLVGLLHPLSLWSSSGYPLRVTEGLRVTVDERCGTQHFNNAWFF